jgi:hypothetical protein
LRHANLLRALGERRIASEVGFVDGFDQRLPLALERVSAIVDTPNTHHTIDMLRCPLALPGRAGGHGCKGMDVVGAQRKGRQPTP